MSFRRIISSALAAAVAATMLITAPIAGAEGDIWNYGFEGSDVGGAVTGYDESLVITDPSDASNHVYNLGTAQITKNVNDTVFTGTYKLSFDFECVSYESGQCAFSAYVYRNGAGYKAADYMSLTANGALQFNGANVLQENGTSLYYLKGGRYHVDWVIDRDNKHQTVTLTGLINSKENQTITVVDADFEDRDGVSFEYTSGIQLKGVNLYIDNIIAAPYTEPEPTEVPEETTTPESPTPTPTDEPTPIPDRMLWSYGFDADENTSWTGYSEAQVVDSDNGTKAFKLDSTVKQISKSGQKLYGEFTYSYDFKADALVSNQAAVDLIRNNASNTATTRDRLTFSNGKALFNGANPVNVCFIEAGKWYHVDWSVDGVNRKYTIAVTGSVSSNNKDFAQGTIELGTFDIPANSDAGDNTFIYTSGIYMINNAPDGGSIYIDNLSAELAGEKLEGSTSVDTGARDIAFTSNHFYKPDTGKVTVTKNGKLMAEDAYTVSWLDTRGEYVTAPVITFAEGLGAGSYTVSFNGINTSYGKAVTLSASFKATAGNPLQGFAETALEVDDTTITGFINGYPISALEPIWKDGMSGTAVVKNVYGDIVTDGGIYDGYTYEVTSSDGGSFSYEFIAVNDIYSSSFDGDVSLSDKTSAITSDNRGQVGNLFPPADAEYTVTDKKPINSSGAEVTSWDSSKFQNVGITEAGLSLTREAAPYTDGKSVSLRADNYAGKSNIQLIKDFYTADEDYPVQISMSIMPDGNGDVSFGIKTSYYGEPWKANPSLDNETGEGLNSLATPVTFMAGGKIFCFGYEAGSYEPNNWYNVSVVLDKVTVDNVTTKKAYAYLNGERIGIDYDWSGVAAQISGNEGFYSVTMRENYKTEANAVTAKTYFDNLQISKLYNTEAAPNGYMFKPQSSSAAVAIDNIGGRILLSSGITPEKAVEYISAPSGMSVTAEDSVIVMKYGGYVRTYAVETVAASIKLFNAAGEEITAAAAGENTVKAENVADGVLIAALYNADETLAEVYTVNIANGKGELKLTASAGQTVKVMGWSSLKEQKPIFDAVSF